MKNNHVLIDYENVQPSIADALAQPVFKVWVFVGAQQAKVKFDLVELLQRKGQDARVVKIASSGRNALDFHMSYYLGRLATEDATAYFHIVGRDTGMDPLLEHMRLQGINVARVQNISDIAIVKASATETEDDKLSRIVEYLVRRGSQRPATLKTLTGSVAALFQPRLPEPEAAALVEQLRVNGVFETEGAKLNYGLPD